MIFDPNNSDVDLIAAIVSKVSDQQLGRLERMHTDVVRDIPEWADRIEVAYVSLETLRSPWSSRNRIAIISPGEPFDFKEAGKEWFVNAYTVRQTGLTLFGLAPETINGSSIKPLRLRYAGQPRNLLRSENLARRIRSALMIPTAKLPPKLIRGADEAIFITIVISRTGAAGILRQSAHRLRTASAALW